MHFCTFLLLSLTLAFSNTSAMPSEELVGINVELKDISNINKGLNLTEGDIKMRSQRNTILGNTFQWDIPVPYKLSANLDLNTKGVILRAFEQFRLKSCIDFNPRTAKDVFYVSVKNLPGCWSYIGRRFSGGQNLSIGDYCGTKAIVEQQFLHTLGFYHEHTRYDRDDYITINFNNIQKGYESDFDKDNKNLTTTYDTPYDYFSLMHYDKNDFSNGNGSTIITKRPEFQDVIGQRLDLSEYDVIKLNKLYKCNSSVSFLDHCSFDESLCQMSVCSAADYSWQRVKTVNGSNVTDHTYLGKKENGASFFMHFSTAGRNEGDTARMDSRTMTPKRNCKVQCLQFYYYHSGDASDQLNIWIREFQNEADDRGTLRLMDQITEPPGHFWKLHHVPLNANKTFQVVFEGRKGSGNSSGGFSLDDINISETECPLIWQIRDFEKIWNTGASLESPLFYSSDGYCFQSLLKFSQNYISIYVRLESGVNDEQLQWPCLSRQITFQVLDQNPHIQKRMSSERSLTTNCTSHIYNGKCVWDNPRNNATKVYNGNVLSKIFWGYQNFIKTDQLTRREFIKGGDLIFLFSMQDISGLLQNDSLPCPKVSVKNFNVTSDVTVQRRSCARSECQDIFCSSSSRTVSSLLLLVICLFLLVN